MIQRPYVAIVLAGGLSSRMPRFKPLLPLGKTTVTDHVIETFQRNDVDVILVGGYRREDLFAKISSRDILLCENPDYEQGMFTSVRAGVATIGQGHRGFLVNPVDIPLVRPATVGALLEKGYENPDLIIYPVFKGRRGHPPLIPSELVQEILDYKGDGGLRAALSRHAATAKNLPVADSGILLDIDTPSDYEEVVRRWSRYHVPTDEECEAIFEITETSVDRIIHGQVTSRVAEIIGEALRDAGQDIDIGLVKAAALLHDIAKGKSRHDQAGGNILRDMGFDRLAEIVGIHTDLGGGPLNAVSLSAKVVYLADKYVRLDRIVNIDERYRISQKQYDKDPDIEKHVLVRKERALQVKQEIESLIGTPLEHIVFS